MKVIKVIREMQRIVSEAGYELGTTGNWVPLIEELINQGSGDRIPLALEGAMATEEERDAFFRYGMPHLKMHLKRLSLMGEAVLKEKQRLKETEILRKNQRSLEDWQTLANSMSKWTTTRNKIVRLLTLSGCPENVISQLELPGNPPFDQVPLAEIFAD